MRRILRLFLPLLACLGMLGAVMPAAHADTATTVAPIPDSNSCYYRYWFDRAEYDPSPSVFTQVSSTIGQPNGCVYSFQYKVLCGVWGTPTTNYWSVGQYFLGWIDTGDTIPPGYPQFMFPGSPTDACPVWGNDIILDVEIVVQAYNSGTMYAWSENNQYWAALCLNGSGVHCNFEQYGFTYWQ